jgi:hypothetical protein
MKHWQFRLLFRLLKWLWGAWGPSDMIVISSYAGTGMEWSLPLRKVLVIKLIASQMKKWKQGIE